MVARALFLSSCALLTALAACSSDASSAGACTPGAQRSCACADGTSGIQSCGSGGAYGACSCGASDGGGDDSSACADGAHGPGCGNGDGGDHLYDGSWESGGPDDAGKLPFGAACHNNTDCESNLCFHFNSKGPHCTLPCQNDGQCPNPPGLGCSGQGVCRVP